MATNQVLAEVIATYGRQYEVEHNHQYYLCTTRGKKTDIAVGDRVFITLLDKQQAVIEKISERTNLFYRSSNLRSKLLAANIDQLWIVIAPEPPFCERFLSRALVAAEVNHIPVQIILNKSDLLNQKTESTITHYQKLGYTLRTISVLKQPQDAQAQLSKNLEKKQTLIIGQSGMGKSSLLNVLIPSAMATTNSISAALKSGKHTTTYAKRYRFNEDGYLIDTPGFQEFGLFHLSQSEIAYGFREFHPYLGKCRFNNCRHLNEPGCAVQQAIVDEKTHALRFQFYRELCEENLSMAQLRHG